MTEEELTVFLETANGEALAAQIVIYRLLGMRKEIAMKCMEKLLTRKAAGDQFDFENYIDRELKKSPSPKLSLTDSKMLADLLKMDFSKL